MEGNRIEIVEDFICLGSKFHKDGEEKHEITRRIKLAQLDQRIYTERLKQKYIKQ
jgi:hypothetical protein